MYYHDSMLRLPYGVPLILLVVILTGITVAVQSSRRKEAAKETGVEKLPPPPSMPDPSEDDPFSGSKSGAPAGAFGPRSAGASLADALPAEVPEGAHRIKDLNRPPPLAIGAETKPDLIYGADRRRGKPLTGALDSPGRAPVAPSSTGSMASSGLDMLVGDREIQPMHPFTQEMQDLDSPPPRGRAGAAPPSEGISLMGGSGHSGFKTQTVRSEKEWNDVMRLTGGHDLPVDFRKDMVVAVFSGDQLPRKLFMIASAQEEGGKFKVRYRHMSIPESTFRQHTRGPWRPYNCRIVPVSRLPVVFEKIR